MADMYIGVVHGFFSVELQPSEREHTDDDGLDIRRAAHWDSDYNDTYKGFDQLELAALMSGEGQGASMVNSRIMDW